MHVSHIVVHLLQRGGGRLDEHIDSVRQGLELVVGDDNGDLDERVGALVQACHLTVDPHQRVRGCHLLAHGSHCSHVVELEDMDPLTRAVRLEVRFTAISWWSKSDAAKIAIRSP